MSSSPPPCPLSPADALLLASLLDVLYKARRWVYGSAKLALVLLLWHLHAFLALPEAFPELLRSRAATVAIACCAASELVRYSWFLGLFSEKERRRTVREQGISLRLARRGYVPVAPSPTPTASGSELQGAGSVPRAPRVSVESTRRRRRVTRLAFPTCAIAEAVMIWEARQLAVGDRVYPFFGPALHVSAPAPLLSYRTVLSALLLVSPLWVTLMTGKVLKEAEQDAARDAAEVVAEARDAEPEAESRAPPGIQAGVPIPPRMRYRVPHQ